MAEAWPTTLVDAVARGDFTLFVGSGVSASSTNSKGDSPPGWPELLTEAAGLLGPTARNRVVQAIVVDPLDAAERLEFEAVKADKLADVREHICRLVDGPADDRFQPSAWHDAIMRLSPSTIVTTNYDGILERAALGGFAVVRHTEGHFARNVRLGLPTILKIHGTVDVADQLILSTSSYIDLRRSRHELLDALRALLLTRVCLFIGYSLTDPDIRLLLEAVGRPGSDEAVHCLLGPKLTIDRAHLRNLFRDAYGVAVVEHPANNYAAALAMLEDLVADVEARRTGPA